MKLYKIVCVLLIAVAGTAIGSSRVETAGPVKLKFPIYRVGTLVDAQYQAKIIERFRKENAGKIDLEIEELPGNQPYVDKMKILMVSGDVPDVVSAIAGLLELSAQGNLFVDLKPYLDADPEWKDAIGDQAIKANSRNGKLVSVAEYRSVAGYYYNKDMFAKAGIRPAATWDEWFTNLGKLKQSGVIPIALMTGENSWTTNLVLGSIIGTSGAAGNAFMNTQYPKTYQTKEFIEALKKVQRMLKDYTSPDAIGATYAVAANNFFSGKAAIIANGIWMTPDFSNRDKTPAGFENSVGIATYPEGGVFSMPHPGLMVLSKDKLHADAAVKLVKAHTDVQAQQFDLELSGNFPLSPKVKVTDAIKKSNPLFADLLETSSKAKYRYVFFDEINYPVLLDQFSQLYPALAMGKITAEEMAKKLDEVAASAAATKK
jgi:raffinose/stachyose/melibiose transport system substrate-binding protein